MAVIVTDEHGQVDADATRGMNSDLDYYIEMGSKHCRCETICECDDSTWLRPTRINSKEKNAWLK